MDLHPVGLAELIDDQGDDAHDEKSGDEEELIEEKISGLELRGRHEADEDGKERRQDAHRGGEPDPFFLIRHSVGPRNVGLAVAELDSGDEHQDIHHEVALRRQGAEDPVRGAKAWHAEEYERGDADDDRLEEQEVSGHPMLVEVLEDGGKVAVDRRGIESLDGADDPGVDFGDRADDEKHAHNGEDPFEAVMREERFERLHEARDEADLFFGDDDGDRKRAQHEDREGDDGGKGDRTGVVLLRVDDVGSVDRGHFQAGEREEHPCEKNEVAQLSGVRDDRLGGEGNLQRLAAGDVSDAQQYDENTGKDRADDHADRGEPARGFDAQIVQKGHTPEGGEDHPQNELFVFGQRRVDDVGDGGGDEGQDNGIPREVVGPLHPYGQKSPAVAKSLADPDVDSPSLGPAGRKLGRYESAGN